MSYNLRRTERLRDDVFADLTNRIPGLKANVQVWMDAATALHTDSPAQAEKDDVIALRDQLVLDLRTILGV